LYIYRRIVHPLSFLCVTKYYNALFSLVIIYYYNFIYLFFCIMLPCRLIIYKKHKDLRYLLSVFLCSSDYLSSVFFFDDDQDFPCCRCMLDEAHTILHQQNDFVSEYQLPAWCYFLNSGVATTGRARGLLALV